MFFSRCVVRLPILPGFPQLTSPYYRIVFYRIRYYRNNKEGHSENNVQGAPILTCARRVNSCR